MVEQKHIIGAIESMLGGQTHRTVEIEGWTVKTDIIRIGDGFSVEKTYGSSESIRYELDLGGELREVLLFDNVSGELIRKKPDPFYQEALSRLVEEAEIHAEDSET